MKTETVSHRVATATAQAQVFLLPPHESATDERADALLDTAELLRLAIEPAVRAGHDDLAMRLLELAQEVEAMR